MNQSKIYKVLYQIQRDLKAPKNQFNSFGKYNYRSCEDILEGLKKIMPEGCYVSLSDEVIMVGDRYYIKATATLICDDGSLQQSSAIAREALDKKGMDDSQITGTASSYARKYALNGLFAIDDTKDADTQDNTSKGQPQNNYQKKYPPKSNSKPSQNQAPHPASVRPSDVDIQKGVADIVAAYDMRDVPNGMKTWQALSPQLKTAVWANIDKEKQGWLKTITKSKDQKTTNSNSNPAFA